MNSNKIAGFEKEFIKQSSWIWKTFMLLKKHGFEIVQESRKMFMILKNVREFENFMNLRNIYDLKKNRKFKHRKIK